MRNIVPLTPVDSTDDAESTLERNTVSELGSCGVCERSEVKKGVAGLSYPYTHVTEISGSAGGIAIRLCDECIDSVFPQIKALAHNS